MTPTETWSKIVSALASLGVEGYSTVPTELQTYWKCTKKVKTCTARPQGLRSAMGGEAMCSFWELQSTLRATEHKDFSLGRRFAAALLPRLFGTNPRSHHKGATGRVRTGDQRLPVLCHCQLGQDIPFSLQSSWWWKRLRLFSQIILLPSEFICCWI